MLRYGTGRRHWLMHVACVAYAVSFLLPAVEIMQGFAPGYMCAYWVEAVVSELNERALHSATQGSSMSRWEWGDLMFIAGAMANHFFLLAYAACVLRRPRVTAVLAVLSALCAVASMLPGQVLDLFSNHKWFLGQGYFVWCAAPMILAAGAVLAVKPPKSRARCD
ncbi:MAG: hypothetical protein ACT4QC_00255 [Planctomycetaceae bacterium]